MHDVRDLHPFGQELRTLRFQGCDRPGFKGKMIKCARHPQSSIDARIVLRRNPRNSLRFHKGQELIAADMKEHMPDLSAFLDPENITAHRLEPQYVFVEVARFVQVQC